MKSSGWFAGLIYIDNYDEAMNSVEEVRQSLLVALVDRKINQYIAKSRRNRKENRDGQIFYCFEEARVQETGGMTNSLFLRDVKQSISVIRFH